MRKTIIRINYLKLVLSSIIVGLFASLLADTLKNLTTYYQDFIFARVSALPLLYIILPSVGITMIYFLRKYLFRGKQNKGIKEIYQTIEERKNSLPAFKIASHYFNGFLTVIFGGSTGVEVSTVVASAAIGSVAYNKKSAPNPYKTELISAAVAAGVSTLFGSPIAGFLFAVEVISRKINKTILISCASSVIVSWLFIYLIDGSKLFDFTVTNWQLNALPYFIGLALVSGVLAVYFTKIVIFIKDLFSKISNNFIRVNLGALAVGTFILFFPQLYGDSYHSIPELIHEIQHQAFSVNLAFLLLTIVILKPLVASLTLGAGGDGGVFAPSIVAGAILGMLIAMISNHYFGTQLIVLNFALVGAASVLSAAIHAPLTSIFLACSIVSGGYLLFIPLAIGSFIAKYTAQFLCGYTVYSYQGKY